MERRRWHEPDTKRRRQFGHLVRELRLEQGLSQEDLALGAQIDRSYLGSVERGERNIALDNIYRIADALGVDVRDLFRPVQLPRRRSASTH